MSQETEWSDNSKVRPQETVLAGQAPADLKAAEAAVAEEWREGDVILDLYEVKGVLGEGGFGKVYRVHHKDWNLDLAVKTPRTDRLGEAARESFRTEAETWVKLGLHPHTVSCYYVRDLGGIPRVFAEYVEGGSLSDWIRTGKLYEGGKDAALKRILDIAIQFAWGLHYAHEQGLVHQDVKPANVMMTLEGVAKVTDFGLAKARGVASDNHESAHAGSILVASGGMTPAYASPEQSAGRPLSRKTDIWSWAVSVLEMFTGEITWVSGVGAAEVLEEVAGSASVNELIPSMPGSVRDLLKNCFNSSPSERPKDMVEVSDRLRDIHRDITGREFTRPVPNAGEQVAAALNNRGLSHLDLGNKEEAIRLWSEALQIQPHHPESTYNQALILWRDGQITDADCLARLQSITGSGEEERRAKYLSAQVNLERGDIERAKELLEEIQDSYEYPREITDALSVVTKELPRTMKPVVLSQVQWKEKIGFKYLNVSFKREQVALVASSGTLYLWDLSTKQVREVDLESGETIWGVSISRDGEYIAAGAGFGDLKCWKTLTGTLVFSIKAHENSIQSVCFSLDGRFVISGSENLAEKLAEYGDKGLKEMKRRHFQGEQHKLNPRPFELPKSTRTLKMWETATGKLVHTFQDYRGNVEKVYLSENGKFLLTKGKQNIEWELSSGIPRLQDGKGSEAFSGYLGFKRHTPCWYDAQMREEGDGYRRTIRTVSDSGWSSCQTSDDGQYLAVRENDGVVRLWTAKKEVEHVAPFVISHVASTEAVLSDAAKFQTNIDLSREALDADDPVAAAGFIRRARLLNGYGQAADALEIWNKLYLKLPRTKLAAIWEAKGIEVGKPINAIGMSNDGCLLLVDEGRAGDGGPRGSSNLWDVATAKCLKRLELGLGISSLSPDGRFSLFVNEGSDDELEYGSLEQNRPFRTITRFEKRILSKEELRQLGYSTTMVMTEKNEITAISFSPDGRFAFAGNYQGLIKICHIESGQCLRTLQRHSTAVTSLSISQDGQLILSGSDHEMKLWSTTSGACLRTVNEREHSFKRVCLSPDYKFALSCGYHAPRLWNLSTGLSAVSFEGHNAYVQALDYSMDGKLILSGDTDGILKLWDSSSGKCVGTFRHFRNTTIIGSLTSARLSPDCRYAVSGGSDGIKIWQLDWELEDREVADWDEGARIYLYNFLVQNTPYAYVPLADHEPSGEEVPRSLTRNGEAQWSERAFLRLLATLGRAGYGWLRPEGVRRELEKMAPVHAEKMEADFRLSQAAHAARSKVFSQAGHAGRSEVFPKKVFPKKVFPNMALVGLAVLLIGLTIFLNLRYLQSIKEPASSPKTPPRWSFVEQKSLPFEGSGFALSPDGRFIVLDTRVGVVQLLDVQTGGVTQEWSGHLPHRNYDYGEAWSPDGQLIVVVTDDTSNTVEVHNISGPPKYRLKVSDNKASVLVNAFSPDGSVLALGDETGAVALFDMKTGKKFFTQRVGKGTRYDSDMQLEFAPDGRMLAAINDGQQIVWDTQTGREISWKTGVSVPVRFSPDGHWLVYKSTTHPSVLMYNLTTEQFLSLPGAASEFAFSHDGRTLATQSGEKAINLWSMETGKLLRSMVEDGGELHGYRALAFSSDDKILIGEEGSAFRIWDVETGEFQGSLENRLMSDSHIQSGYVPLANLIVTREWRALKFWAVQPVP